MSGMPTCWSCGAFLQPTWDRCKICGASAEAPAPDPEPAAATTAGSGSGQVPRGDGETRLPVVLAAIGVGLLALACTLFVLLSGSGGSTDDTATADEEEGPPTLESYRDLCVSGTAVEGAKPFTTEPGYHGVLVFVEDSDGNADELDAVRDVWPAAPELVACATRTSSELVQTCTGYEAGHSLELHRARYEVVIRAASTGDEVATAELEGPAAAGCPGLYVFDEPTDIDHGRPRVEAWVELLRPHAAVPDASGQVPIHRDQAPNIPDRRDGCVAGPLALEVRRHDGTTATLQVEHAAAIRYTDSEEVRVLLADFGFDERDVAWSLPAVPEGGTLVSVTLRRVVDSGSESSSLRELDVRDGQVYVGDGEHEAVVQVLPEPEEATTTAPQGQVTVTRVDDDVLCLDVQLRTDVGPQAVGRVSATVVEATKNLYD